MLDNRVSRLIHHFTQVKIQKEADLRRAEFRGQDIEAKVLAGQIAVIHCVLEKMKEAKDEKETA